MTPYLNPASLIAREGTITMPLGIIDTSAGFLLGPHQVFPYRNCVVLGETAVNLEPKIMEVCQMLAARAGDVVSREELIDGVWGVKFGSDESLTRAIYVLRKTFGRGPSSGAIIETVSKRGYRLAATVAPLRTEAAVSSVKPETRPSIAVLAFVDMSESRDQEHFSDGVSEEIINALVPLRGLKVAGRTSSFSFKSTNKRITEIGDTLNVDYVLEGSVRKHGGRLRITAQLINARDDAHLWSHNFDGDVDQVFDLQDEIARSVCEQLKVILHFDEEPSRLAPALTSSNVAYDLFLRGRSLNARIFGEGVLEQAEQFLKRAVELDPDFAEAWAELAFVYVQMAGYLRLDNRRAVLRNSVPAAKRAINLKPDYGFAWSVQSWTPVTQGDIAETIRLAERGYRLDPDHPDVAARYGYYMMMIGRSGEAMTAVRHAVDLDPIQGRNHMILSIALVNMGDIEGADRHAQRAVELGYHAAALAHQFTAYAAGNNALAIERSVHGARTALTHALPSQVSTPEIWHMVASALYGGSDEQRAALVANMGLAITDPERRTEIAYLWILLAAGAIPEFLEAFGSTAAPGNHLILAFLWGEFRPFCHLREHPDFMTFAERIGLKAAWDAYGYPECWHGAAPVPA